MPPAIELQPEVEQTRDALLRAAALDRLRLEGAELAADVSAALIDVVVERDIGGASTVTLELIDPADALLNSGLFDAAVRLELLGVDPDAEPLAFVLDAVSSRGVRLTLTFVDAEVAELRKHDKPRKADRAKVTRAEFGLLLVREVGSDRIRFYSPELHKRQPIKRGRPVSSTSTTTGDSRRSPGIPASANLKVKGKEADRTQLRNLDTALSADVWPQGVSETVRRKAMIALIEALIVESRVYNLRGGDRDSVGILQVRALHGSVSQRRNIRWCVDRFLNHGFWGRGGAIALAKKNPHRSAGWIAQQAQGSGVPGAYDTWDDEAIAIWRTFTGGTVSGSSAGEHSITYTKRYVFRRGEQGKRENTWDALGRLAEEVKWRRFMDRSVLFFVADDTLMKGRVRYVASRDAAGVDELDFDFANRKDVTEVTLTVWADQWSVPIGAVVEVTDQGPNVNGRYLVANVRESLFNPKASVKLVKPTKRLPEPAPETETSTVSGASSTTGGSGSDRVERAYAKAKAIDKQNLPYVWGGGHGRAGQPSGGGYDCSGFAAAQLEAGGMAPSAWQHGVPASSTMASSWGKAGRGKELTMYANAGHVFLVYHKKNPQHAGTGRWGTSSGGPGLKPKLHPTRGFRARHYEGT